MKKIFSFVIVAAAAAMIGCGGNATKPAETEVAAEVVAPACKACDSTACCGTCDSAACCGTCEKAVACEKAAECCKK